jgi:hypothetical protein
MTFITGGTTSDEISRSDVGKYEDNNLLGCFTV